MAKTSGETLLINAQAGETRLVWLKGGDLVDLEIWRGEEDGTAGAVYWGRVDRLEPGMGAACMDLGSGTAGLLPLRTVEGEKLTVGTYLAIKVVRAAQPDGGKGAKLSARLGAALTWPPLAEALAAQRGKRRPGLLLAAQSPARVIQERRPNRVLVDDVDLYQSLRRNVAERLPEGKNSLILHTDVRPLFEAHGVEGQFADLVQPSVSLPGGGSLLIEPGRTLTAIDVNAGQQLSGAGQDRLALAVNQAAVAAIARELRRRALSGLIVIDFLPLADEGARRDVVGCLRAALKTDPAASEVFPMSPSGLVEMSRQRRTVPLHEVLTRPCGLAGSGREWRADARAFALLRRVRPEAAAAPGRSLTITAPADVIDCLRTGAAAPARAALEQKLGQSLILTQGGDREEGEVVIG